MNEIMPRDPMFGHRSKGRRKSRKRAAKSGCEARPAFAWLPQLQKLSS